MSWLWAIGIGMAVTSIGLSLAGIGSAFWAIVAGGLAMALMGVRAR